MASKLLRISDDLTSSKIARFLVKKDTSHVHSTTANMRVRDHLCFLRVWLQFSFRMHCITNLVITFQAHQHHLKYQIQVLLLGLLFVRCLLHLLIVDWLCFIIWVFGSIIISFEVSCCMLQFSPPFIKRLQVHSIIDLSNVDSVKLVSLLKQLI